MNKRKAGLIALVLFTIVAVLHVLDGNGWLNLESHLLRTARWVFIASLVLFALYKRSLTTWIMVAMVIGVEIGLDFPKDSQQLKFLSTIFLRLVKTIVAPLLFATLVVGIASHANLKQVGRMGWKSLLYFEVVTTIALVIGLLAINITGAGKGITIPHDLKALPPSTERQFQQKVINILDSAGVDVPDSLLN